MKLLQLILFSIIVSFSFGIRLKKKNKKRIRVIDIIIEKLFKKADSQIRSDYQDLLERSIKETPELDIETSALL